MPQSPAKSRTAERRRALNLTMVEIADRHGLTRPLELACECGHAQCWETYPLGRDEYDSLRAAGEPALAPAHSILVPAFDAAARTPRAVVTSRSA